MDRKTRSTSGARDLSDAMLPPEDPLPCKVCNKIFPTFEKFHKHKFDKKSHFGLFCLVCSKDFATREACKAHQLQYHAAKQNLQCPACAQRFTRLGGLIHHIEYQDCKPGGDPTEFRDRVKQKTAIYNDPVNMRNRTEYGQTSGDFREDDLLTFDNDGPESAQAKSVKATPEIIYGKPSRPTPNPTPNPTKLRPSTEATPSKPRGLSARFEAGDLISFDETSQNLKDPRDVPPQRTAKGVYGSSTGSQISSAKGPNNPQLKSAWSTKKDLFPSTEKVTPSVGFANPPLPEPSSTIVNTGTPPQNEARRDGPNPLVLSPFDPDNPTFRADSFFDPDILPLGKYKCPHTGCGKSCPTSNSFISHLKSAKHAVQKLQCRRCLRYFASATALTQHSESQGVNCNVRDTDQFTACVDEFTAGTAAPAGRFKDNTIKYVVNKFDKLEIDKAKAALDAANKAHAADQATFWTRHVPKY